MPTLGVSVVVLKDNEVLLVYRQDYRVWGLPGGTVDDAESLHAAAEREVREETGITVELAGLAGVYTQPAWQKGNHEVLFGARPIGGALKPKPGEIIEVRYFPVTALPEPLFWWQRRQIETVVAATREVALTALAVDWPFAPGLTREQICAQSGMSENEFIARYCGAPRPAEEAVVLRSG